MMLRKLLTVILVSLTAIAAGAATYTVAEVPNVQRADSTQYLSNPDGIIGSADAARANEIMRGIRRATTAETVAVVVDDIDPADIDLFANELYNAWGLGQKDVNNGLLILVAKDLRRAVIRTGPGLEGVLPDILCKKILQNDMFPAFRENDYGRGLVAALGTVETVLTDPEAAAEIRSELHERGFADGEDVSLADFFGIYFGIAGCITLVLLVLLVVEVRRTRGRDLHARYTAVVGLKPVYLALTFFGLGLPALASVPLVILLNRWRNTSRKCPNCGTRMEKVDEVHDNDYLTPSQDTEERVGSVDYDVWLCPVCGETDIEPYVTANSGFRRCEACGGLTSRFVRDRILCAPTRVSAGKGVKDYSCAHCGHLESVAYTIPMIVTPVVVGGGGRSGGGGGGFSGGGFGGGFTGGGGASGGW